MGDNGEKDMLDALGRAFEDEEPLPKNVTNRLLLGGLKMVYGAAKDARARSITNENAIASLKARVSVGIGLTALVAIIGAILAIAA